MNADMRARQAIARNLQTLMADREWSQAQVAARAGCAQKSISNLLKPDRYGDVKLELVESVARAFGLELWHMLLPDLPPHLLKDRAIPSLIGAFAAVDDGAREHILSTARREAERHR